MTTTEDETNCLPFTVRRTPCSTSANVIVLGERDTITGAGRALPLKGLSAMQPGKTSTSRCAQKALIRFIRHRTPCGPQKLRRPTTDTFGSRIDVPIIDRCRSERSQIRSFPATDRGAPDTDTRREIGRAHVRTPVTL